MLPITSPSGQPGSSVEEARQSTSKVDEMFYEKELARALGGWPT